MAARIVIVLGFFIIFSLANGITTVNVCNNPVYCYGKILEAVNYFGYYKDAKTFVDMPLRYSANKTVTDFDKQFPTADITKISNQSLNAFLDNYFYPLPNGSDVTNCTAQDWNPNPPKFQLIKDKNYRNWAFKLNQIWHQLCKRVVIDVKNNPDRHTLIYLPHEFIVPGGRFRELFYWDSFWIIRGLLVSGMYHTSANMIYNLAYLVKSYSFVPNGNRIYFLQRSQPPFLIPMVYEYYTATKNLSFVQDLLPTLYQEFQFWINKRQINVTGPDGKVHSVFQYNSPANVPRPESYRQDVKATQGMNSTQKANVLQDINSACETGWDFSSRWFGDYMHLKTIKTRRIVPVDLNALMFWNMDMLQWFYQITGNITMSKAFEQQKIAFRRSLTGLFFNNTLGAWFDWDLDHNAHNTHFYPSVAVPLFTGAYQLLNTFKPEQVFNFMNTVGGPGVLNYPGGIPASTINTTQQWDYPNGWSLLNHMIIEGLRKSRNPQMEEAAFHIANRWVSSNYKVFMKTGHMFEKYDVTNPLPAPGSGGEYDVQTGFGWTNGVILDLLYTYGDRLVAPSVLNTTTAAPPTTTPNTPIANSSLPNTTSSSTTTNPSSVANHLSMIYSFTLMGLMTTMMWHLF